MTRIPSRMAVLAAALASSSPALAAGTPRAFEGRWDCQIGEFVFDGMRYDPGTGPIEIQEIEHDGDVFILRFADGYQIFLALHPDGTMGWFSPASGEAFECRRLD
ncbi:hypothetical protein [Pseudogemmobacter sonorensis]|uniref:hypothetical protein n=1 Tax=Pseudogemmobacter sonorensis TaxID=2989681 RepID=UPI0036834DA4